MAARTVPITGLGATISGLGITASLTSISAAKIAATPLDVTILGASGYERMRPGDLRKAPKVTVEFYWMGTAPPITTTMIPTSEPYAGTAFTIAFTGATNDTLQGTAFVEEVDFPSCKAGEIMKGSMTIQFDGGGGVATNQPTYTAA